ncbi:HlyD family type I secretion periplasmic adaptor subunit [Aliiroseovarius lamellibrachiae]|uniref:HlyD family type I secretion periplasmic adaptor subunit n=1 Tax=Aliiroseovarius lamellibrachiae TaxID=1924933 RepID=UPI001BE0FFA9|nr:HlyD family type I secretion periplasmic adaptor subunit [Aliiroseovarius lamellibrachiae]MBT2131644.1 HlyD family type I secretion periplasmic adaptor subunit [Aliiroseovarius lamellibrachiae]
MSDQTASLPAQWYEDVPRSVSKHIIFGITLMAVSFGGFSLWAFRAPLAAAVITQGSFVATGRNKIVQHLEGGIIKDIDVSEGDTVVAGQVILTLDKTSATASQRELFLRKVRLEASEARILAEYGGEDRLIFPIELDSLRADFEVATILDSQRISFDVAVQGLRNDIALLERNIDALQIRSSGYATQLTATQTQLEILQEDLLSKETLLEKGLVRRIEVSAIRRAIAEAEGSIGRLTAEISEFEQISKKYQAQIDQTTGRYRRAALDELQSVQSELESVREKNRKAQGILTRSEVRAPVAGTVVRLHYHTVGGVIESGKAIAEILPSDQPLIIEAQVPRTEIDSVKTGQPATVRLTALNQRTTPILEGMVYYVSADTIPDKSNGIVQEVYLARVSIAASELKRVPGFTPTPGMPTEIMIQTAERTFIQYITKPITDSMTRAFREQ